MSSQNSHESLIEQKSVIKYLKECQFIEKYVEEVLDNKLIDLKPNTDLKNLENYKNVLRANVNSFLRLYNYFVVPFNNNGNEVQFDEFEHTINAILNNFMQQSTARNSYVIINGDNEYLNFKISRHITYKITELFSGGNTVITKGSRNFLNLISEMTTLQVSSTKFIKRMSYVVDAKFSNNLKPSFLNLCLKPVLFDRSALNEYKFSGSHKNILTFQIFHILKDSISLFLTKTSKTKHPSSLIENLQSFESQVDSSDFFTSAVEFIGMQKDYVYQILTAVFLLSFGKESSLDQIGTLLDILPKSLNTYIVNYPYNSSATLSEKMKLIGQDIYHSLLFTMIDKYNAKTKSDRFPYCMKIFVSSSYCDLSTIPEITCDNTFYQLLINFNYVLGKCIGESIIKSRSSCLLVDKGLGAFETNPNLESNINFLKEIVCSQNSLYGQFLKGTNAHGLPTIVKDNITYKPACQPIVNRCVDLVPLFKISNELSPLLVLNNLTPLSRRDLYSGNTFIAHLLLQSCENYRTQNQTFADEYFATIFDAFDTEFRGFDQFISTIHPNKQPTKYCPDSILLSANLIDGLFKSDYDIFTFDNFKRVFKEALNTLVSFKFLNQSTTESENFTDSSIKKIENALSIKQYKSSLELGLSLIKGNSQTSLPHIRVSTICFLNFNDLSPIFQNDSCIRTSINDCIRSTGEDLKISQMRDWVNPTYTIKDIKKAIQYFNEKANSIIAEIGEEEQKYDVQKVLTESLKNSKKMFERFNKNTNPNHKTFLSAFINPAKDSLSRKGKSPNEIIQILKPFQSIYLIKVKRNQKNKGAILAGHDVSPKPVEISACLNCGSLVFKEVYICKYCEHTFCSHCYERICYNCPREENKLASTFANSSFSTFDLELFQDKYYVSKVISTIIQVVEKYEDEEVSLYRRDESKVAMYQFLSYFYLHYGRKDAFPFPSFEKDFYQHLPNSYAASTALKHIIANSAEPIIDQNTMAKLVQLYIKYKSNLELFKPELRKIVESIFDNRKHVLFLIISHLNKMMKKSSINLMTYQSMGVCFAPILAPNQTMTRSNPKDFKDFYNNAGKVVEFMIEYFKNE